MKQQPSPCDTCLYPQLADKLTEANDDLEEFTYVVSHDLREPLIGIAGFATLLMRRCGDDLDDQGRHFIEEIIKGTKRMEAKIDDLLQLSRAGRSTPMASSFPLGAAIEEAKRNLVGAIQSSGATIHIEGVLPHVEGDRSLIARVFQNLFSNSIKYRKADEPPLISVAVEAHEDGMWLVTVGDNGIGFEMIHQERIFKVFQRLYTVEQYPGTGIGLAIVKKVVERHGGKIWVLSEPQKGTKFFFTLPRAAA